MASIRVIGTTPISITDWNEQQLTRYLRDTLSKYSQGGGGEGGAGAGNVPAWASQLIPEGELWGGDTPMGWYANTGVGDTSSGALEELLKNRTLLDSRLAGMGGFSSIGFTPQTPQQALQGYLNPQVNFGSYDPNQFFKPDASGNMLVPLTAEDDIGHDLFGLSFGGSDGGNVGGIVTAIEEALLGYGAGAAGGASAGASSTAGFGDAAYAGASGSSAGAAGASAGSNLGNAEFGSGSGGINSSSFDAAGGVGASGSGTTFTGSGSGSGTGAGGGGATNNTGTTGGSMGDETGAFDQSGSAGVFDSQGNPIYQSPGFFDQLFGNISGSDVAKFLWNNKGTIGALLGGAAGAASANGTPAGTVTTTTDVPDWLKPYVQGNVAQGSQTLAGINPNNPLLPASQAQALATIRGDYLNPNTNPYLQQNVNDALGLAKSQYLGLYGGPAGLNVNNTGFQEGLTRNLGTVATQAYGQNYANERQNQNTATFGAPQLVSQSNAAYFSPNQAFAGLFPNVSSTQTPYFTNTLGSIFSGALGGGALGKAFA